MSRIALVVLDTLRKDIFDEYFGWIPGKKFDNAWAPSHWTVPVHASLFTGRYPSEVGASVKSQLLNCESRTLAEYLSAKGYTTRAFSANPKISRRFNYSRGFDIFRGSWRTRPFNQDLFDWGQPPNGGAIAAFQTLLSCIQSDEQTLPSLQYRIETALRGSFLSPYPDAGAQAAKSWIQDLELSDDEFLFMNLMEAHAPYNPPEEYQSVGEPRSPGIGILRTATNDKANQDHLRKAYAESVEYLSDIYKEVFDYLIDDFDLVITLGDHGEMFGEHGVWEHDYSIHPELTHVPLVISQNKQTQSSSAETVSLLDIYTTILSYAGHKSDRRGRDLLGESQPQPYLTEYAGLTEHKVDKLREAGLDDLVSRYDSPKRGIILPPSYYGYESLDGFIEIGNTGIADPQKKLSDLTSDIPNIITQSTTSLSSTAQDQLEDLGYI